MEIPDRIMVKRKHLNFFVSLEYKKLPEMCFHCGTIEHVLEECGKKNRRNSYNFNGRREYKQKKNEHGNAQEKGGASASNPRKEMVSREKGNNPDSSSKTGNTTRQNGMFTATRNNSNSDPSGKH